MNQEFLDKGYTIIPNLFTEEEINLMREISLEYFKNGGGFSNQGGYAKPDYIKEESLQPIYELIKSKDLESIIENLIGEPVEFVGHNDLHLNRSVGWHKDRLNNDARVFEAHSPWDEVDGETMKIYKVNLYLQDHTINNDALVLKEGNHLSPNMETGNNVTIHPAVGDVVIFDQRINHCATHSGGYDRVLICMGYGVKNIFFDEFKEGTEYRQNKQNNIL